MRLAFLSDIHGNYYALKAVLEYLTREDEPAYDRIICLGDILAGHGGNEKVIALLNEYNVELIQGNHDGKHVPWETIPEKHMELMKCIVEWDEENISAEIRERLGRLPKTLSLPLMDGRTLLAFHSNPDDLWDMVNGDDVTSERMKEVYGPLNGDVLVYGHYHQNHVMEFQGKLLINAGSVSGTVSFYPDKLARLTTIISLEDRLLVRQEAVAYDVEAQLAMDKETNSPFWQFRHYVKS